MELKNFPLWTALVTPFKNEQEIDFISMEKMFIEQENAGNGILILGSTGEGMNLTSKMRESVLNFAVEKIKKVPIMVGVGGINIDETLEWIKLCNKKPIHSYLLVTPLYAKPGAIGQYNWFKALMDESKFPCMLYNIPSRSGVALNLDAVKRLVQHQNFWAIKEASGSVDRFKEYKDVAPNAKMYSGDDGMTPSFCQLGGVGLVSVASNVWPIETHEFMRQCLENGLRDEGKVLWDECADTLFQVSNPVPAKGLLHANKIITTPIMRAPLHHEDLRPEHMLNLKNADQRIRQWYKAQNN